MMQSAEENTNNIIEGKEVQQTRSQMIFSNWWKKIPTRSAFDECPFIIGYSNITTLEEQNPKSSLLGPLASNR